ncbi:MAG: sulfatase [Isosphaeraceae bacterium]|nr:sulfatase [Isosphaeraceae bacterium]
MIRPFTLIAALTALVAPSGAAEAGTAAAKRPNVLLLISDDMRTDLGCYGNPLVKTPNLDALAAKGVRFERAYVQYPLCNPSRSSMLTGRYPTTTGVMDNRSFFGDFHPEFVSLPKYFKANGYATLRSGKIFHEGIDDTDAWTEGGEPRLARPAPADAQAKPKVQEKAKAAAPDPARTLEQRRRSDRIIVLDGDGESHPDYKAADRAIDYLRRYAKKDEPFFLACGFVKPHAPPSAPRKFFDLYDPAKIPLPPDFGPEPKAPEGFPKASILIPNIDLFVEREATPEAAREMIRAYWASISWADWNVGRVLAELDRLGLRDDTIIVFWGDHGYHLGEKGKWSKHRSLFEVVAHVPLIIAAPGAQGNGRSCPRLVESIDIYPTLVELCGLSKPEGLEGRSLVPLLEDPRAAWDHPALTFMGNANRLLGLAVRTDRYRYAEYFDPEKGGVMLFDEEADPHEMKNLADDPKYADVKARLARHFDRFRKYNSFRTQ